VRRSGRGLLRRRSLYISPLFSAFHSYLILVCTRSLASFLLYGAMRCFPILGLTPSLDVFPSHWSHLCCASTASISPPSFDGMDISRQRVPPHVAHCISHRNGWSALLRCSSCPLDCSSQLGQSPYAFDNIQAIQHIHTALSAALIRSRLGVAAYYGITRLHTTRRRNGSTGQSVTPLVHVRTSTRSVIGGSLLRSDAVQRSTS
jgi:hypothetical protein